jgi:hypothetical protein
MKTEQVMERVFEDSVIKQTHKNGYFNVNDLAICANRLRAKENRPVKDLNRYFLLDETKEYMMDVSFETGVSLEELKITKKGRLGGTYVHPYIFIDMAMWFDSKLKVKIVKWLYDNLIYFRDISGDSFKEMNDALKKNFPDKFEDNLMYKKVSNYIANACNVPFIPSKNRWNLASEKQLEMRENIQKNIILLSDCISDLILLLNKSIEKALKYS